MKIKTFAIFIALCIAVSLSACGKEAANNEEKAGNTEEVGDAYEEQSEETKEVQEEAQEQTPGNITLGNLITDQTFQVSLKPLGEVQFSSYEPAREENPLSDAVFTIGKTGDSGDLQILEGMYENNTRTNEIFNQVEAVSFPDYNGDGYEDIIVICSYSPASGAEVGSGYSEARIYAGSASGSFTLEKELSEETNSALNEITVKSVLGFLGANTVDDSWKNAYIDYLQSVNVSEEGVEGYDFIYLNEDDIPEIVEIGNSEAAGSRIVYYYKGEVHKYQLNRLYFSYIQKENLLCNSEGNMDYYYDLVYSLVDGEMIQVAAGYYGAEDNSNLTFDEAGNPIYVYEWNGQKRSEKEYKNALNEVFDSSRAVDGYSWDNYMTREEMIEKLKE